MFKLGMLAGIMVVGIKLGFRPDTLYQAEQRYGKLYYDYGWKDKDKWLIKFDFGEWSSALENKYGYINRDMFVPLMMVMIHLRYKGLTNEIKGFQGCYNPRGVRGATERPSTHAYGLGCDFNNGPFSEAFIQVWEHYGFCWGGHFTRKRDPMHFSYSWECSVDE